jgi:signal transduction histidine kinase
MPAEGDPRMLRLVLETLFDNAWKFTGRRMDARVELGIAGDGSGACFVRDNGAGFDMAYADRLFAPFQRLHPEEEFPGTGIGLATVRRIVNRHGGRIWAAGAPGEGAVFHFTLRPGGACGPGEGKEAR